MTESDNKVPTNVPWYVRLMPHWPTTWPGTAAMVAFLIFVGLMIFWIAHDPRSQTVIALFDKSGKTEVKLEHVYVFTTASYLTKYDLTSDQTGDNDRHQQFERLKRDTPWYFVSDPTLGAIACSSHISINIIDCLGQEVLDFKKTLDSYKSNELVKRIQGYEIYESYGSGSSTLKRGLTWKVTVPIGSAFEKEDLIRLYVDHWHRTSGIYIEDIGVPETRK